MKLRLFPKDEKFFELFLQQAAAIDKICRQFRDLSQNWSRLQELVAAIQKTEHEGDELRHQTAVRLARTFVTPLDREDIHELSAHMDDILDRVQGAAVRLLMLEVGEPRAEVALLADILVQASELLEQGVEKLPTFTDINELRRSMHRLEHEGDRIYRGAISQLHQNNETVADIVNLIKWTDILDRLENGIDKFEDVFDIIQGIIIKYR
ncbi:DUF47 family protein [bacterium CPR1]|nr:DUF47 family protein [bacterium CPR1]